jgi:Lrp/AsnC family transcriptional regulator for asnA, asnC and gidA
VTLDNLDRLIVKMLRHDGRLAFAEIAQMAGVSKPTIRKRVDRLVDAEAIVIAARVNPAPIGLPVDALVCIRATRGRMREVGSRLAQMENIGYLAYLAGSFDILIEAFLPDAEGLFRFLNEDLAAIDGVAHAETWHVLRTEKFFYNWGGEDVGLDPSLRPIAPRHLYEPIIRQGSLPHGPLLLDGLDRRIMKMLRHDGRLTYARIAREVGVSEPTARKRVDRLVHAGAIAIMARVNPAAIGFPLDAYVGIRVARGRVTEVGSQLAKMENVGYLAYVAGSFDIVLQAFLPDNEDLFTFLSGDLEEIDGINYSETWHVLHTEKYLYNWDGEDIVLKPTTNPAAARQTEGMPSPPRRRAKSTTTPTTTTSNDH